MIFDVISHALVTAFNMGWAILWPLILGFGLSAVIQAAVARRQMAALMTDNKPRTLAVATAFTTTLQT